MLFEIDNAIESASPIYYFFAITLLLAVNSPSAVADLQSGGQFVVYRLHQIEYPHTKLGTRGSPFILEAITPTHLDERFVRKCAIFKFGELLQVHYETFVERILDRGLVSGVLVLFNDSDLQTLSLAESALQNLQSLERRMMTNSTDIPIYFIEDNEDISALYEQYNSHADSRQALNFAAKNIFLDTHQLVISDGDITPVSNPMITNFQVKFAGTGVEEQLPTYAIVAHYDSYSFIPSLAFGSDSNASGFVVFMELMRVFSRLYSNPKTKPKANLLFFLSGGGKLNYFGTKKWLEENLDTNHAPKNSLFESIKYVVCLDSLADSMNTDSMFMYVSKPPKPDSAAGKFHENLLKVVQHNYPTMNASLSHKKINLAEPSLSWEHERFSLRKISAFSLSALPTSQTLVRKSLLDRFDPKAIDTLERATNIIAETLSRQLFENVQDNIFVSEISRDMISSTFEHVSTVARSQQNLLTRSKASNMILPEFLRFVQSLMRRYAGNNQIKLIHYKTDSSQPEFTLFNPISAKLNIYTVKPALFDLLITISIAGYISVFYYFVKHFSIIYSFIGVSKHSENGLSHRSKSKK